MTDADPDMPAQFDPDKAEHYRFRYADTIMNGLADVAAAQRQGNAMSELEARQMESRLEAMKIAASHCVEPHDPAALVRYASVIASYLAPAAQGS